MSMDSNKFIGLGEFIEWVKAGLFLTEENNASLPLFVIDEVTIEVNFVLSGEGKAGIDLKVLSTEASIGEERVQKATVRLKPIVPYEKVIQNISPKQLKHFERRVSMALIKGAVLVEEDVPPLE